MRTLGDVDGAPPFEAPRRLDEWRRRRIAIRRRLWSLLGDLPPRPARLRVVSRGRERRAGYWLERIAFDNGAGAIVPGYVVVPAALPPGARAPAILYAHWHGGEYAVGKDELLRADHTPAEPAATLAARGYVVLAIDAYGFGERDGQGPGGGAERGAAEELSASKLNLWLGRTLWGMIMRDDCIALDYLASRPDVDAARIGATGISMGATRTWWLMALDDRIRAGVAVACLTRYESLIRHRALAEHGIYYYVPGILRHFDTEAIVALAAPRPLLCLTGDRDPGSPVAGVRAIARRVRPVYDLYGEGGAFESVIYRGVGHEYVPDMWRRMLDWMDRLTPPDVSWRRSGRRGLARATRSRPGRS